jgi:flagellar biosynthesis/type III secretory pathway chaperone
MEDSARLYDFLHEYANFLEEMETVQKEKLDSLLSKDLQRMERSIKSQQAYAMRLDNIENRRIRLQTEVGFGGLSFSELIDSAPQDRKNDLKLLFGRIHNSVSNIKYLNGKSAEVADLNVRRMGSAVSKNVHGYETEPSSISNLNRMDAKV